MLDKDIFNFTSDDYLPLVTGAKSQFYGNIKPSTKNNMIPMLELTLRKNKISIDDGLFFDYPRSKEYVNLARFRVV